jgi:hypothetical protein
VALDLVGAECEDRGPSQAYQRARYPHCSVGPIGGDPHAAANSVLMLVYRNGGNDGARIRVNLFPAMSVYANY